MAEPAVLKGVLGQIVGVRAPRDAGVGVAMGVNVHDVCSGSAFKEAILGWKGGDVGGIVQKLASILGV